MNPTAENNFGNFLYKTFQHKNFSYFFSKIITKVKFRILKKRKRKSECGIVPTQFAALTRTFFAISFEISIILLVHKTASNSKKNHKTLTFCQNTKF